MNQPGEKKVKGQIWGIHVLLNAKESTGFDLSETVIALQYVLSLNIWFWSILDLAEINCKSKFNLFSCGYWKNTETNLKITAL